jgi:tetratricopeptide repeat protein 8
MEFILAASRYSRGNYEKAVAGLDQLLAAQPTDEAAWQLKCNALTRMTIIRDTDAEEVEPDAQVYNPLARQGTTLRGSSRAQGPASRSGVQRVASQRGQGVGSRLGTQKTRSGRQLRLGTASLVQKGGKFIDADSLNVRHWAQKKNLNKCLFNYLYYCEQNYRVALELATVLCDSSGWWKLSQARCLFKLGLYRDASKELGTAVGMTNDSEARLLLSRVYQKLDQSDKALACLQAGLDSQPY